MVLDYGRGPQQVLEIYGRMGRARAQQVLKYGSWSLPIFVGRSFFDSSKQFRGDFKPFSSEFGRFWAILGGFERFCAGSECFPAAKGVRSRGGSRYGSASPASIGIFIGMVGPSKYWGNIWNLFAKPYTHVTVEQAAAVLRSPCAPTWHARDHLHPPRAPTDPHAAPL